MKFCNSLALALAPVAMARKARSLNERTNHEMMMEPVAAAPPAEHVAAPPAEHVVAPPAEHVAAPPAEHAVVAAPPAEHVAVGGGGGKTEVILIWANPGGGAKTETIHEKVTVTQTVTAGGHATAIPMHDGATTTVKEGETATVPAAGASHTVTVGGPGGLVFFPDQLNDVPVGDTIIFEFLSQNHTVTQSPFDTPCKAIPDGMDSGFMANPNNTVVPPPQVAMQVMGDKPLWFYCKQANHCGMGMVFSVNPTAEKTHAMFQQKAIEQNGDGKGTPVTGGEGAPPPPAKGSEAAAPPPAKGSEAAAPPPAKGGATGNAPGQGQVVGGSCVCMVSCSAQGFPAAEAQGLNARGGMAGSLPLMAAMS